MPQNLQSKRTHDLWGPEVRHTERELDPESSEGGLNPTRHRIITEGYEEVIWPQYWGFRVLPLYAVGTGVPGGMTGASALAPAPFCSDTGVVGRTSSLGSTMLTWSGRGFLGPILPLGSQGSMIFTLIPSTPIWTYRFRKMYKTLTRRTISIIPTHLIFTIS